MSDSPTKPASAPCAVPDEKSTDLSSTSAVTRRTALRHTLLIAATVVAGIGVEAGTREAQAQTKIPKVQAAYQGLPNNGQRCGLCTHYRFPFGCEIVQGPVSIHGWCKFFAPRA
jgi:hypothetical protein